MKQIVLRGLRYPGVGLPDKTELPILFGNCEPEGRRPTRNRAVSVIFQRRLQWLANWNNNLGGHEFHKAASIFHETASINGRFSETITLNAEIMQPSVHKPSFMHGA